MTPDQVKRFETRFGVRFPADWKRWSPDDGRSPVRGVATLYRPEDYVVLDTGAIVVGLTTEGAELALLPKGRSATLRDGVYALGEGRPRKVAARFRELLADAELARSPRPDELAWAKRNDWATYLTGSLRLCADCGAETPVLSTCGCGRAARIEDAQPERSPDAVARARAELPDLFAAAALVERIRSKCPWLDASDVLALETARVRRTPAYVVLRRWTDRGLAPEDLPGDAVRAFLGLP